MEEQQGLAALFPNPPPFYQSFTPSSISQITESREKQLRPTGKVFDPSKELPPRILELPTELRFLQPPPLPETSIYKVFGDTYNVRYDSGQFGRFGTIFAMLEKERRESNADHDIA